METAIDEALGDVVDGDAGFLEQGPRVDDALMRDAPVGARVEHVVRAREAFGDIIGVQNRDAGRLRQPFAAHHQAVAPRDREDRGRAIGRRRNRRGVSASLGMAGQEWREMRLDADRSHARPSTAMRDAKGLMQI